MESSPPTDTDSESYYFGWGRGGVFCFDHCAFLFIYLFMYYSEYQFSHQNSSEESVQPACLHSPKDVIQYSPPFYLVFALFINVM